VTNESILLTRVPLTSTLLYFGIRIGQMGNKSIIKQSFIEFFLCAEHCVEWANDPINPYHRIIAVLYLFCT
jgi:hypothetical protein